MATIAVAGLSLLASRPAIDPGWGEIPVDRPRPRSRRWRRLLAGMAGLTRLQPGPCCGCATGVLCNTCSIPKQNLTLSFQNPIGCVGGGTVASTTLVYTPGTPTYWESACICTSNPNGSNQFLFYLWCVSNQVQLVGCYFAVPPGCVAGSAGTCGGDTFTTDSLTCGSSFLMTAHDPLGQFFFFVGEMTVSV